MVNQSFNVKIFLIIIKLVARITFVVYFLNIFFLYAIFIYLSRTEDIERIIYSKYAVESTFFNMYLSTIIN